MYHQNAFVRYSSAFWTSFARLCLASYDFSSCGLSICYFKMLKKRIRIILITYSNVELGPDDGDGDASDDKADV